MWPCRRVEPKFARDSHTRLDSKISLGKVAGKQWKKHLFIWLLFFIYVYVLTWKGVFFCPGLRTCFPKLKNGTINLVRHFKAAKWNEQLQSEGNDLKSMCQFEQKKSLSKIYFCKFLSCAFPVYQNTLHLPMLFHVKRRLWVGLFIHTASFCSFFYSLFLPSSSSSYPHSSP